MTQIGHFEILSELSKSSTSTVYKANDPKSGQTVALKAINLSAFGDQAKTLRKCLLEEAESTKILGNPNLTTVFGAGEIDGRFCATMEYVQGNSVQTVLERKEGFSIWDLIDIGRQVCGGLDDAHSHKLFHYSLEPAKIMCGWDGTVRILSFGVSSLGKFTAQMSGIPTVLHYMSPEQVREEAVDARSNLFSVGALFYEMATDHKAFNGEDAASVRQSVLESVPPPPVQLNPKLHPLLSDLIMKALAKDPSDRYQSGHELLEDLEKCKETKTQAVKTVIPIKVPPSKPVAEARPTPRVPVAHSAAAASETAASASNSASSVRSSSTRSQKAATSPASPQMLSALMDGRETETLPVKPKISVDPMMAGENSTAPGKNVSFSEMTELPPLKETFVAPTKPPTVFEDAASAPGGSEFAHETDKPRIQPREVAGKAIKEIKNVPPSLIVYSVAGAAVLILIIAVVLVLHINRLNREDDLGRTSAEATNLVAAAQPASHPGATPQQAVAAPDQVQMEQAQQEVPPAALPARLVRGRASRKKAAAPVIDAVLPGQMAIDSTPPGAQVDLDGKTDPSWITPFALSGIAAGQHTVTVTKAGYVGDTKTVDVPAGQKAFVIAHLSQLMATLSVTSSPAGANVFIDGRDIGKVTPAQVSVDKGQHVVLVRKAGYLDETTNAQFVLAQTVSLAPALRPLGNVDDIRTTNKLKKLFGSKEEKSLGSVSVRTQPKSAQVAVNQHMLDRPSPVDFTLDPGNYVVDITLTGYTPIHKVVSVDRGGKAVIDETMQHQ